MNETRPRPLVIAHRGASAVAPENTIEAFTLARELGADWVELDVRRTGDGALVVIHDPWLPGGTGVHEVSLVELPPEVPLLREALDACKGMGVNVEVKNSPKEPGFDPTRRLADEVVTLLASRPDDRVLLSSFDLLLIDRVREIDPLSRTALLTFELTDPQAAIRATAGGRHVAIHPWFPTVDAAFVSFAHRAGLAVNVWTVDDPEAIATLATLGVDGIVTNAPGIAREVLG